MTFRSLVPLVCLALPPVFAQEAQPASPKPPTKKQLVALQAALVEMDRTDQLHRTAVSWGTTDPKELARLEALDDAAHLEEAKRRWREGVRLPKEVERQLMARQRVLDQANFEQLIRWVKAYGYPDPERLGIEAPSPVAVLIHADNEWFAPVKQLLREEARQGRMNAKEFAAVSDRKAQHAGQRQLYGTCRRFDPKTNQVLPPEIEDIEQSNRARKEIGLPPLEEYRIVPPKRKGQQKGQPESLQKAQRKTQRKGQQKRRRNAGQ